MGATTSEGTGVGSAEGACKGPGNGRNQFVSAAGPHIVASGVTITSGWKTTITFPTVLSMTPDKYVIMLMQSDIANDDGHGSHPPHVEKLDANGHNQDDGFDSNLGGFVLHNGDGDNRTFMWMVATTGFAE